jgi:hypothetical protein
MSTELGDLATVTGRLADRARRLAAQVAWGGPGPGEGEADGAEDLAAVGLAKELGALAGAALRLAVERAHARGHTWEDIGERLGVSPQAAYQRFGRARRPPEPPRPPVITDAAERAIAVLADWFDERYGAVTETFDETMAENMTPEALAATRAQVTATAGPYQRLGDQDPLVRQAGDYTVADVPMVFGTGLMKGRVAFDRSGLVVGLYVMPTATP